MRELPHVSPRGKAYSDFLYLINRIAEYRDGKWVISWKRLRTLDKETLRYWAYRISQYVDVDPDDLYRQIREIWESRKILILNPYENDVLVLFRSDVWNKYLFTFSSYFRYKIRRGKETIWVDLFSFAEELNAIYLRRGLLSYIPEALEEYQHPLGKQLPEEPPLEFPPERPDIAAAQLKLRDYQVEVLKSIWRNFRTLGAATVRMAAGAGKTEVAVAVTAALRRVMPDRFRKIFFVTLNTLLLWQAKRRFLKYGFEAGLITKDYFEIDAPIVCCTIQTLYKAISGIPARTIEYEERLLEEVHLDNPKYDRLRDEYMLANLVIVDECHHIPARTVRETLYANPYALRLALSATPWKDDMSKMEIYAATGKIIEPEITSSYLVPKGYLVPADIIFYVLDLPEYKVTWEAETWHEVESIVFLSERRNEIIAEIAKYLVENNIYPVLVLVRRIEQGKSLERMLREYNIDVAFLYGAVPISIRETIINLAEHLRIQVLIATQLADEGFDLPPLRALILASGGKSSTRALQRVGRVVRPIDPRKYPEAAALGPKKVGLVIDIADNAKWLLKHAEARERMYSTEPLWRIRATASRRDLYNMINMITKS